MFASTVSRRLVPNEDNEESFKEDPPMYELSHMNSCGVTPIASRAVSPAPTSSNEFPFPSMDEEGNNDTSNQNSGDLWELTVLANVHKLDNLAEKHNVLANHLKVNVTFTANVCRKGRRPDIIDISNIEFKQGDYIHGYVTIENTYHEPIPFDMLYVVFEGVLYVFLSPNGPRDVTSTPMVVKFLNMLDLHASWSYANIDRLVTDSGNPHDWCEGEIDPFDGTYLSLGVKRTFEPKKTYKRFFSFCIPDRLLDDACEIHSLDEHCQILPTLGKPVSLTAAHAPVGDHAIKDLGFTDSFIEYSVSAKVIGRASQYGYKNKKDKYVLIRDANVPLRVVPYTVLPEYPDIWNTRVATCHKAFSNVVERKLLEGKQVLEEIRLQSSRPSSPDGSGFSLSPTTSAPGVALVSEKLRNLYLASDSMRKSTNKPEAETRVYQHSSPYRKKTLTGYSKILGTLSLSSPETHYRVDYVPPLKYRNPLQGYNCNIRVPLTLTYARDSLEKDKSLPDPKSLSCELVALTIRSKKHFVPIEFNHEMCFLSQYVDEMDTKKREDVDNFDSIVIQPFLEQYHTLVRLMKDIGFNNQAFRVETLFFKDLKSLATLQTKKINLAVPDVMLTKSKGGMAELYQSIAHVPWEQCEAPASDYSVYTKQMELDINLNSCHLKGSSAVPKGKSAFDSLCLVPGFQSCLMARFYYIKISVKYKSGTVQLIHVPLFVVDKS